MPLPPNPRPQPPTLRFVWSMFWAVVAAVLIGSGASSLITGDLRNGLAQLVLGGVGIWITLLISVRSERRHVAETQDWFDEEVRRRRAWFEDEARADRHRDA